MKFDNIKTLTLKNVDLLLLILLINQLLNKKFKKNIT